MDCGYDVPFLGEVDTRFLCPICLLVLRDAVQTSCGHRFCDACIKRVIDSNNVLTCPVDKMFSRVNQIFPDVAIRREILSLTVRCSNVTDGCQWTGELRALEKHRESCEVEVVTCPHGCELKTQRSLLEEHVPQCPSRLITCTHCEDEVTFNLLEAHMEQCPKALVTCDVCGVVTLARENLDQHRNPEAGSCSRVIVPCPFKFVGCRFQAERFKVKQHVTREEPLRYHLEMAGAQLAEQGRTIEELHTRVATLSTKMEEMVEDLQQMKSRRDEFAQELRDRNVMGKLHWKVKVGNNSRLRATCFDSPAFYTGCPGYKVQVTLDLEGHREAGVRYVSLHLNLLQGMYDEQLIFPFNATCMVTVYDQGNNNCRKTNTNATLVVREMPRVLSRSSTEGERFNRRGINKFMKRHDLVGVGSRYLKYGAIHLELAIVHCFYPPPEMSYSPGPCLSTLVPHSPGVPHSTATAAATGVSPVLSVASLYIGN